MNSANHPQDNSKLRGVWVALATPFDSAGEVCLKSLEKIIDSQIAAGVDGFVPLGTTGESPTLTAAERDKIIAFTVEKARRHSKRVIAGCGGNDTKKVVELVKSAATAGCDGTLVITPYYNKPTQEGLCQHFLAVADASTIPVLLYHAPGRTGVTIAMETFARLFEHPRIAGVKEASGNHQTWLQLAERFGKSGKVLLSGDDDMMATFCAMGGQGIISASCNVLPKPFVRIWKQAQEGNFAAAFQLQLAILPAVRAVFAETNPGPVKYGLSKLGFCENLLRLPLVPVRPETERLIDQAFAQMQKADLL
jgi:4-hydroxy-tetrahydrodipicolinate synthase